MDKVPNGKAVLNSLGEKGWDLRGCYHTSGGNYFGAAPVREENFSLGIYRLFPTMENNLDVVASADHLRSLRREGLGSRIYFQGTWLELSLIVMHQSFSIIVPAEGNEPIVTPYNVLEKRIRDCFGPNLRTGKRK